MFDSLPNCFSDEFVLRASELLFYVVFNDNLHHYYVYIQIFKFICIIAHSNKYILWVRVYVYIHTCIRMN